MARELVVTVKAFPRIHMCLIDMGDATARVGGGVGFSVDGLPISVTGRISDTLTIRHAGPVTERTREELLTRVASCVRHNGLQPCDIVIESPIPEHNGFGSKTAIVLATLSAMLICNQHKLDSKLLCALSGRGGLSGIGSHAFFLGGVIADAGHKRPHPLMPSSCVAPTRLPPLAARLEAPTHWRVALLLPPGIALEGQEELDVFKQHTPIDKREADRTLALVYHAILPAFAEVDIASLEDALSAIHSVGFKKAELASQPVGVADTYRALSAIRNAPSGMSSMGPLLYTIYDLKDEKRVLNDIRSIASAHGADVLGIFPFRNSGFETNIHA